MKNNRRRYLILLKERPDCSFHLFCSLLTDKYGSSIVSSMRPLLIAQSEKLAVVRVNHRYVKHVREAIVSSGPTQRSFDVIRVSGTLSGLVRSLSRERRSEQMAEVVQRLIGKPSTHRKKNYIARSIRRN